MTPELPPWSKLQEMKDLLILYLKISRSKRHDDAKKELMEALKVFATEIIKQLEEKINKWLTKRP